jgi:hypothetical protein
MMANARARFHGEQWREAIMHDMINTCREDGEGDYTQADPKQDAYDIGIEPLFPTSAYPRRRGRRPRHWPHHFPYPLSMPRGSAKDGELYTRRGQGPVPSLVGDINRSHLQHQEKEIQLLEEGTKVLP